MRFENLFEVLSLCSFAALQMNLASQSVLEGLNACLDHRGEVDVSVLGRVTSLLFVVWLPCRCTSQNLAEHSQSNRAHISLPARILHSKVEVERACHDPLSIGSLRFTMAEIT